jgi:hypothetical protein
MFLPIKFNCQLPLRRNFKNKLNLSDGKDLLEDRRGITRSLIYMYDFRWREAVEESAAGGGVGVHVLGVE